MGIQCLWKSWAQGAFSSNFPKLLSQSSPFWQLLHIVLEEQHLAFSVEGAQAVKLSKKAKKKPQMHFGNPGSRASGANPTGFCAAPWTRASAKDVSSSPHLIPRSQPPWFSPVSAFVSICWLHLPHLGLGGKGYACLPKWPGLDKSAPWWL